MNIPVVTELPFQLVTELGEGKGGAVYSLAPLGIDLSHLQEEYESGPSEEEGDSDTSSVFSQYTSDEGEGGSDGFEDQEEAMEEPPTEGVEGVLEQGGRDEAKGEEDEDGTDPFETSSIASDDDQRLHADTAMGRVQMVSKVTTEVDEISYWIVADYTDPEDPVLVSVHGEREEAYHWRKKRKLDPASRKRAGLDPHTFRVTEADSYEDDKRVMKDFFRTEVYINQLLTQLVNDGVTPHVLQYINAFVLETEEGQEGYMQLERVTGTLFDVLNSEDYEDDCGVHFENEDVAALFFQSLVGLGVCQDKVEFKHHDYHTSNVFVQKITAATTFKGQPLDTATHFHYHINGTDFYIPNSGVLVKVGDFGFSSVKVDNRAHYRIDMECYNDDTETFGVWSHSLEGNHGYDAMMMMCEKPFINDEEVQSRFHDVTALVNFARKLRGVTFGKTGRVSRAEKRPLPGHVSDQSPYEMILEMFGESPQDWYDFRAVPQPGLGPVNIITLGSTEW